MKKYILAPILIPIIWIIAYIRDFFCYLGFSGNKWVWRSWVQDLKDIREEHRKAAALNNKDA